MRYEVFKLLIIHFSFPGIDPKDDILSLLKLMVSKNPMNDIDSKIALNGGYDPCTNFFGNESFWTENAGCEPGFVPDKNNVYCYKVLSKLENFNNGKQICKYNYKAEMVLFHSNLEVKGLIKIILQGVSLMLIILKCKILGQKISKIIIAKWFFIVNLRTFSVVKNQI